MKGEERRSPRLRERTRSATAIGSPWRWSPDRRQDPQRSLSPYAIPRPRARKGMTPHLPRHVESWHPWSQGATTGESRKRWTARVLQSVTAPIPILLLRPLSAAKVLRGRRAVRAGRRKETAAGQADKHWNVRAP